MRSFLHLVAVLAAPVHGQVVSYEPSFGSFPEAQGWQINDTNFPADRYIEGGQLVQVCEIVETEEGTEAEKDTYDRSIAEFAGADEFFMEWRVETDGPSEAILSASPAVISAGGQSGLLYHFTIADDTVRFLRDPLIPDIWIEVDPGLHTFYLQLSGGAEYVWYIDGVVADCGVPEGAYPNPDSKIIFRGKAGIVPVLTCRWSFVRYGVRPPDGFGDYDSSFEIDGSDQYFFEDCLSGPQGSWPGCAWADMDQDGDTDCDDWELFKAAWTDTESEPFSAICDSCLGDLAADGQVGAADLAMVLGAWGPAQGSPVDLDGDGTVGPADLAEVLGAWGPCE